MEQRLANRLVIYERLIDRLSLCGFTVTKLRFYCCARGGSSGNHRSSQVQFFNKGILIIVVHFWTNNTSHVSRASFINDPNDPPLLSLFPPPFRLQRVEIASSTNNTYLFYRREEEDYLKVYRLSTQPRLVITRTNLLSGVPKYPPRHTTNYRRVTPAIVKHQCYNILLER